MLLATWCRAAASTKSLRARSDTNDEYDFGFFYVVGRKRREYLRWKEP
jgi:hypothetical protein